MGGWTGQSGMLLGPEALSGLRAGGRYHASSLPPHTHGAVTALTAAEMWEEGGSDFSAEEPPADGIVSCPDLLTPDAPWGGILLQIKSCAEDEYRVR